MMKTPLRFRPLLLLSVTLLSSLAFFGCSSHRTQDKAAQTAPGGPPPAAWSDKMQSLSRTLSDLLPLVASQTKFNDQKNFQRIQDDTSNLKTLAHSLKSGAKPNPDPSMPIMSGLFEDDINRALQSLKSGNRDYARGILNDTTAYCIQCHTQTANGPEFPRLHLNINTSELNPLERAEFYTATRQFDLALQAYADVLSSPAIAKADPFQWEQAARAALAIVVRVKKDPKASQALIEKAKKNSGLPIATQKSIRLWLGEIQDWKHEKPLPAFKPETAPQYLKKAEQLIIKAQNRQEFPLDHSQDILYFRAAGLLHDLLSAPAPETSAENKGGSEKEFKAQALYLAGVAAEATRDMNFWTLHETYYEMCIRTVPHTDQAKSCFARLKDSVTLGYSGSGGVQIPQEVAQRLSEFQTLSEAVSASPSKSSQ